jgi:DNA adenine methylase
LVPYLEGIWKSHLHRRLVEPFVGGLSVALGLVPERALLNDLSPELINFYRVLQSGLVIPPAFPMDRELDLYLRHRDRFNALLPRLDSAPNREAAALLYFLNRTCFNGLHRLSSSGKFNVAFGRHKTINYVRDFTAYAQAFSPWTFTLGDFERVDLDDEDFLYVDPPYDGGFDEYTSTGFDWDDQLRLFKWARRHRGPVVISNAATDRVVELYRSAFDLRFIRGPRSISRDGDRTPARELLATRNLSRQPRRPSSRQREPLLAGAVPSSRSAHANPRQS